MPPGENEAPVTVTDEDRQAAAALLDEALTGGHSHDGANELVARALVAEREKSRVDRLGGLPNNPEPGKVAFRIEAWPHDPGANGEEHVSGHMRATEAAGWLREIADRAERYWGDPECPWDGQPGHVPSRPAEDQSRAEEAKRAAYEARRAAEEQS